MFYSNRPKTYKTRDILFKEWAEKNKFIFVSNIRNTIDTRKVLSTIIYKIDDNDFPVLLSFDGKKYTIYIKNVNHIIFKWYYLRFIGKSKILNLECKRQGDDIIIISNFLKSFKEIYITTQRNIKDAKKKYLRNLKRQKENKK